MTIFKITVKLYFVPRNIDKEIQDLEEFGHKIYSPEKLQKNKHECQKIKESFKNFNFGNNEFIEFLKSKDPNKFVEGLLYYYGYAFDAKWILEKDTSVSFKINIPIKKGEEVEINEESLFDWLLRNSLEDGEYEGEDWVVFSDKDHHYEYGLIDYRKPENIKVKKL